jgi:hypothetical protein
VTHWIPKDVLDRRVQLFIRSENVVMESSLPQPSAAVQAVRVCGSLLEPRER